MLDSQKSVGGAAAEALEPGPTSHGRTGPAGVVANGVAATLSTSWTWRFGPGNKPFRPSHSSVEAVAIRASTQRTAMGAERVQRVPVRDIVPEAVSARAVPSDEDAR